MSDMPGAAKEETSKRSLQREKERNLQSRKRKVNPKNKSGFSFSKRKVTNRFGEDNGKERLKKKIVNKALVQKSKSSKKQASLCCPKDKSKIIRKKEGEKPADKDVNSPKLKRRRRRKKRKNNVELDEASRLQRRTRYLLVKVKLEQNLVDAYSAEGWKGQSREKIRPEKELQRAKKQILKCKLGIRDAIHQLDLLSSVGRINDSAVAPDGSVHHEYIICAKCKLREALPDNDIILCDGTCNRAFHQKCMDPPLSTENIPPGDEGWFCKFCKKKMEILEATNAHLGTHFPMDSSWQDVFKEEAELPDDGSSMLCPGEEWPSDDSEDDDYDPFELSRNDSISSRSESDASDCSSSFLGSLEDETLLTPRGVGDKKFDSSLELIGIDSDEVNDGEVLCRPRQRAAVNYIKLYDEMFGKNATENEQFSEDEDWGPTKKRRKVKETDAASTLMTLGETERNLSEETPLEVKDKLSSKKMKRPIFRLPHDAVKKLRLAFMENELPTRELRESLSEQLGLEFEKVNKWFKNARYLALKARKAGRTTVSQDVSPSIQKEVIESSKGELADPIALRDNTTSQSPQNLTKFVRRSNGHLMPNSLKKKQQRKSSLETPDNSKTVVDLGDDVSLKHLREKAKEAKKKLNCKSRGIMLEAESEMERLCQIKSKVEKLQQVLFELPNTRLNSKNSSTIYVPVAELKEKSKRNRKSFVGGYR